MFDWINDAARQGTAAAQEYQGARLKAPTFDKGYALTSDQTGDAIAEGAKAGGSAFGTLAAAIMGNRAQKKAKKIKKIQREGQHKNYIDATNESLLQEGEGDRAVERDRANDYGVNPLLAESSAHDVAKTDYEHQNDMRLWALRKHRADLKYGYEKGVQIQRLSDQMDRINQQTAVIGAAIDSVVQVAGIVSDREVKRDFDRVECTEILGRVIELPMSTWRYEWEPRTVRHMGPMAQDWRDRMGLGASADGKRIDYVDGLGVALAAIKGLAEHVAALNNRIRELEGKRDAS